MDPISITAAALVVKALDEFATETGRRTWAGLGKLVELIRSKFAGDDEAAATLAEAEGVPADPERVDALASSIDRHVQTDPAFRAAVTELVRTAEGDPMVGSIVTKVSGSAQVGKLVNISEVRGDVSF
ncbi:hypothetical protein SAMN04244553_0842 [Nocardia amikacinitolerans]|uniref:Uncharacterized protein n=1 Tax=Nocardia amikacinitolerans TaxID=756689 RepID=A0A285KW36_9NOCA|nr:hypothetical protein [Nocardia amikacinitolerans]SNY76860.1 hypothetical protein SAMN04244553_0842 [Nocardia amikacinitolerans]